VFDPPLVFVLESVRAAVEPLPLAPVVAAAPVSIESTSVMGMKETSDPVNTTEDTLVVMAVFDVEASIAVSRKYSGPTNVCAHVAAVVPSTTQSIIAVTLSKTSANSAWKVLGPAVTVTGVGNPHSSDGAVDGHATNNVVAAAS